jgi:PAS domain S-box-containing protein
VDQRTAELLKANTLLKRKMDELNHTKEGLRVSEEELKSMFLVAPTGIGVVCGRVFQRVNDQICEMTGYSKSELMGQCVRIVYPSDEEYEYVGKGMYKQIKEKGTSTVETNFRRKDGQIIRVVLSLTPLDSANPSNGIIFTALDITKRKQAEKEIQTSKERLSIALRGVNSGIWDWNIQTGKIFFDANYFRLAGYEPNEFDHNYEEWKKRIHPDDLGEAEKRITSYISGKEKRYVAEFRFKTKNNDWMWILDQGKISEYDDDGNPVRFTGIHLDINRRKKAETEKIKAQQIAGEQEKYALVGQIAGKMAHDFNNILGIIMCTTELSLMNCKDKKTRNTLALIHEETLRGKNLTKNLVAFAKNQDPKLECFKISDKIDLVLDLMKKDLEGVTLIKDIEPDVPELLGDPGMIEGSLVNLIQNSIHALGMVEHPIILIRTYSFDNKIYFEIEDNGCGILKEHLERIYDPSFTQKGSRDVTGLYKTDIKGTGYGLANVKKFIEQHKGNILVKSEPGSGTKFTITLPVPENELTDGKKTEIIESKLQIKKKILLVEDEIVLANLQRKFLTQEPYNHRVDIANTGQIAVDLFNKNEYDLISLDYILMGNMNGMEVYNIIREKDKTIPILFTSGNMEFLESIKELKEKDTHVDYLSKPCQNKRYINTINQLLERTSA